jgi:hypothetical protein
MREAAEATMIDAGKIGVRAAPTGGEPSGGAWTYGETINLGVKDSEASEVVDGSHATISDATIRVPLSVTTLAPEGRIQVTNRHLSDLASPVYYAIQGEPRRGITSWTVSAKKVTGESVS